jgi:hypothetical protein
MIRASSSGDFNNTKRFAQRILRRDIFKNLDRFGRIGVDALASATPVRTGLTASSWHYRIINGRRGPTIEWYNTDVENGAVVAILIQYGHGTRNGGYIQGIDYVNPAIRPVFDYITNEIWKEVIA